MSDPQKSKTLTVGMAQIAPVWLNRERTLDKIMEYVDAAARKGCELVAFGEALLPGYPFWIEHTDGARFNSTIQKEIHAHYLHKEELIVATLDYVSILKERQNFDPAGHYSRPDVTQLTVNRKRQSTINVNE